MTSSAGHKFHDDNKQCLSVWLRWTNNVNATVTKSVTWIFLINKKLHHRFFPIIIAEFWEKFFYRTPAVAAFEPWCYLADFMPLVSFYSLENITKPMVFRYFTGYGKRPASSCNPVATKPGASWAYTRFLRMTQMMATTDVYYWLELITATLGSLKNSSQKICE